MPIAPIMNASDRPAVLGGTPLRAGRTWPSWPQWDDTERAALLATLDEGAWWSGNGHRAQAFADDFARFHDARYGLALTNGTHTLEAALWACGIGEGDEVIVPGLTFVATATAVLAANATPVLVDIDPGSLGLDVVAAENAITSRTRAVIAVHIAGNACDLDALVALCERHELHLVEDCAHAHGTTWNGRGVGSFGSFGSFSMQQSKLMTAGEGGVLISNDGGLSARAASYANCGRVEGGHWYHHPEVGTNLRMTEWQGAVLSAQLARFVDQHRLRNENATAIEAALADVPGLTPLTHDPRMDSQGHYCFVVHYDERAFAGLSLADFERALAAEGIPVGVSYPALNTLDVFRENRFAPRFRTPPRDYSPLALPNAERAAASTVWIEHRVLLAERSDALDVVRAAARVQRWAPEIAGRR